MVSDMKTSEKIRQSIAGQARGTVFSSTDFLSAGTRAAVDQALFRLMKAGTIVRVARGLYAAAGQHVDAQTVASALANKTGERVGLAPAEGRSDVLVVPTSGLSRTVKAAGHTVEFRRMSQRKVQLAASPEGRVLLALWTRGRRNLTTLEIQRATGEWPEGAIDSYAARIPAWLRAAIEQANAPRKSTKIGLSGAYDWSNSNIRDDVPIGKVLETHKFEDVARLCFYCRVPRVERVFRRRAFEPMTSASVTRMLSNISKGRKLPIRAIDPLLDDLAAAGTSVESLITPEQKSKFIINTSENLDHYIQDYLIDGAKVTFHSRNVDDRPKAQIEFLKSAPKVVVSEGSFDVLGIDGLLAMKSIVVYDRVRSRDLYDLMILTRDHGYTLDDIFAAIDAWRPIRNKNPEHFKCVVTGVIWVDKNDEGFSSIHLGVKMDEIYGHFKKLKNDYEIRAVQ